MRQLKIRFKKYNDVWENVKLTETAPIVMGQSPDSKNYTDNPNDYILVQGNADMQNGRVVPRVWTTQITKLAEKGDLILSVRAPVGDIGKTDYNVVLGRGVAAIKGNEFIFQLLSRMKQFNYWSKLSTGSTFESINSSDIKSIEIYLPSQDEQSAIGSLFRTLDNLLSNYKDNLANYQSLKATMLSKMFPEAGQTVPEIRLKGFEGEWVEKCIGELADIVRGASPRPIQDPKWFDSNSEIGWLRISDVTSQNGRIHSLGQKISKLGQEKTRVLGEPHLLLSIAATVGKPVINYVKTGVHDGFLIFMNPKFDREFMFQWLEMFREKWNRYGQPGSQVNLNSDIVKNQKIFIPSIEEQCAIGSYFSNLDNLINSYQEKISQLETLKKKLLQDMFI
ncbi:restriction endonuclease subunit S [Streptococcus mitis]|uniref:restriction endonuclease subunit S n=1 Tax=Streptococcus mitis TaxID=28037 RepID=UPI0039C4D3C6